MAYFSCTIDGVVAPASTVRLSEGYNEGWTVTAYIPRAIVNAASAVTMQVNDGTHALTLTLTSEKLAEDGYGVEVSFRDSATRRLSHSTYDGSTLHCISADTALARICTASSVGYTGNTGFGNIHYAATDEQNSLSLLTDLLDTCAAYYRSNGQTVTVQAAQATANCTLEMAAISRTVTHEGLISRLYLNKVTPCDIVASGRDKITFAEEVRIAYCLEKSHISRNLSADVPLSGYNSKRICENINELKALSNYKMHVVGISARSCPSGYSPSFTRYYDNTTGNLIKYTNRTSTIWATKEQATARASYYLWLENRDFKTATYTIPLNLAVRAGDVVADGESNYRVTAVTHSLSINEATTEVEASAI